MPEADVVPAVKIGLVATDAASLLPGENSPLQGEVIVLNCIAVENTDF